jgi:putative transposase
MGIVHFIGIPYYPQSNVKLERYHKTIKGTSIRVNTLLSLTDAQRLVTDFVDHYKNNRLHSAISYITPNYKLECRAETILAEWDAKLAAAREENAAHFILICAKIPRTYLKYPSA